MTTKYFFLGFLPAKSPHICECYIGGELMPDLFTRYLPTLPDGLIVKHLGLLYKTAGGALVLITPDNAPVYVSSIL